MAFGLVEPYLFRLMKQDIMRFDCERVNLGKFSLLIREAKPITKEEFSCAKGNGFGLDEKDLVSVGGFQILDCNVFAPNQWQVSWD
jgi:hypothetical protein